VTPTRSRANAVRAKKTRTTTPSRRTPPRCERILIFRARGAPPHHPLGPDRTYSFVVCDIQHAASKEGATRFGPGPTRPGGLGR